MQYLNYMLIGLWLITEKRMACMPVMASCLIMKVRAVEKPS